MYSYQLQCALTNNEQTRELFHGVYPSDKIPDKFFTGTRRKACIVNLDKADKPGSHWISLMYDGRGNIVYFDSYGLPPEHKHIVDRVRGKLLVNNKRLQSVFSSVCGYYCLYCILEYSKGCSLSKIVKRFTNDFSVNDKYVRSCCQDRFLCSSI